MSENNRHKTAKNVLGGDLLACSHAPKTGYFRDGFCRTCSEDTGVHTICSEVSAEFLAFSKAHGNDLSTPRPEFGFPGLQPGDRWCLCAGRWLEAKQAGVAPPVVLAATHESTLRLIPLFVLREYACG